MFFITTITLLLSCVTPDPQLGEKVVTIPFDQIWASHMPGTKDIHNLDWGMLKNQSFVGGSLNHLEILKKNKAEPGFAVSGKGQDALVAAFKKTPEGKKPLSKLPVGTEISVVYFSHAFPIDINLKSIERIGSTINITYRFEDSGLDAALNHIALIPLGKLPVGKYSVNMVEIPPDKTHQHSQSVLDSVSNSVCQSFDFTIYDAKKKEKPK